MRSKSAPGDSSNGFKREYFEWNSTIYFEDPLSDFMLAEARRSYFKDFDSFEDFHLESKFYVVEFGSTFADLKL